MGRPEDALAYLRRAVKVNPWIWEYRHSLAKLLALRQDWPEALRECEAARALHPTNEPTLTLLISCLLRCGKKEQAQREFEKLLALNPAEEKVLRAWFAAQMP
jgi:Flp pilus assembly protein TadD